MITLHSSSDGIRILDHLSLLEGIRGAESDLFCFLLIEEERETAQKKKEIREHQPFVLTEFPKKKNLLPGKKTVTHGLLKLWTLFNAK